jgi:hypothetical protein
VPPINFWLAVFAGFTAGYVMALSAFWMEGFFGLPRIDLGITGIKYLGGEAPGWWFVGIVFHLVDAILLGVLYAAVAFPNMGLVGLDGAIFPQRVLGGLIYGVILWAVLAMCIVMPLIGVGVFGSRTGSPKTALASLLQHLVYGILLGAIYV